MEQFDARRQRLRNVYVVWNDLTPTAVATVVFGNDLTPTPVAIVEQFLQSGCWVWHMRSQCQSFQGVLVPAEAKIISHPGLVKKIWSCPDITFKLWHPKPNTTYLYTSRVPAEAKIIYRSWLITSSLKITIKNPRWCWIFYWTIIYAMA